MIPSKQILTNSNANFHLWSLTDDVSMRSETIVNQKNEISNKYWIAFLFWIFYSSNFGWMAEKIKLISSSIAFIKFRNRINENYWSKNKLFCNSTPLLDWTNEINVFWLYFLKFIHRVLHDFFKEQYSELFWNVNCIFQ